MNHFVLAYGGSGPLFQVKSNGRADRVFKPDEDIYPSPLMTLQPSCKMTGAELDMAVCYFQYERVKHLVAQHQDENVPEQFMTNIDAYLTPHWREVAGTNMANVPYHKNEYIWNRTIESLLNAYTPDNLGRLMATLGDTSPVAMAAHGKRPLAALVLIHYGCPMPGDADEVLGKALCARIKRALNVGLPSGQRLLPLTGVHCAITLDSIKQPLLLGDGQVYEREAALRWLSTSDSSPGLNTPLAEHWFGFDLVENRFVCADYVSSADKRKTLEIDFSDLLK